MLQRKKDRNGWRELPFHYGLVLPGLFVLVLIHFDEQAVKMLLLSFGLG